MVPDSSRIIVLRNGTWNGSKVWMVDGGHTVWPLPCSVGEQSEVEERPEEADEEHHLADEMKNSMP